ncbi:hypothetical protein D3C73_1506590 [compost metagenome]
MTICATSDLAMVDLINPVTGCPAKITIPLIVHSRLYIVNGYPCSVKYGAIPLLHSVKAM